MTALLTTFNLSFNFVLGAINTAAGMLLAINIFDFPLLGWAAAGGVLYAVISLFGRDDEDDDDDEPIILEDDSISADQATYENLMAHADEFRRYEKVYQKEQAQRAARKRNKTARAAVRNFYRLREKGKLDD